MMSFCKKSVHSFLGLTTSTNSKDDDNGTVKNCHHQLPRKTISTPAGVLTTLLSVFGSQDITRPSKVVESAAVSKAKPSPPLPSSATSKDIIMNIAKRYSVGSSLFDVDVFSSVNALTSCTESLGFESSEERMADDQIESMNHAIANSSESSYNSRKPLTLKSRRKVINGERKRFPPPLSSLNRDGTPNFYLRSVRKDGRLELTEVKIHSSELLRTSRQDGRLRLQLVHDDEDDKKEEEAEENIEERGERRRLPTSGSGGVGDGFKRCYDELAMNQHHDLHAWRQRRVTSRWG